MRRSGRVVAGGGGARWTGVPRSALAWHEGEPRRGVSRRRRLKRGSPLVGRSPYSRTRRWLRAAEMVGGEAVGGQGGGRSLDMVGMGGVVVRTGRLTGGP
jgi:hypothetical protein